MFNFLLAATGLILVSEAETETQRTIGAVLTGVGLTRTLNEWDAD